MWVSHYVFTHTAPLNICLRAGALLSNTTPRLALIFGLCGCDFFLVDNTSLFLSLVLQGEGGLNWPCGQHSWQPHVSHPEWKKWAVSASRLTDTWLCHQNSRLFVKQAHPHVIPTQWNEVGILSGHKATSHPQSVHKGRDFLCPRPRLGLLGGDSLESPSLIWEV